MGTKEVVKSDLESGNFRYTNHAGERGAQRSFTRRDIIEAAKNGDVEETGDSKFVLFGYDSAGEEITVICGYDNGTLIITAY